jgi:hypothetical protein
MKETRDYPWFDLRDYEPRRQFGVRDWAIMLLLRDRLPDDVNRYSQTGRSDAKKLFDKYWDNYLDEALPSKYWNNKPDERYEGLLPSDVVFQDVTHLAPSNDLGNRLISTFAIENSSARLLQVDVLAPDAILIRAFESWLRNFRKKNPLPIRRRGKRALNLKITPEHLKSWTNYNILAVLDLDLYAGAKKWRKLSYSRLFEKLSPVVHRSGSPNPEGWGVEARNKAREGLGCLYSLIAQAKFPG